jgi:hypothetical protein
MSSHLDATTIDRYLSRSLDRAQLDAFDDHVTGCLPCLLVVESAGLDESRWERRGVLGRLTAVLPPERVQLPDVERVQRAA